MSKISVIIPTYNCGLYLGEAIESVLSQTFQDHEIIVIDDGSTDDTKNIVRKYVLKYPEKIRYFYQKNMGPSAARNVGIREAEGEFIAFLDADDIFLPEKLDLQMAEILKSPSIGLVTCGNYVVNANNIIRECSCAMNCFERDKTLEILLTQNIIRGGGSTVMIRRECFKRVGLFDEEQQVAEDWDMWLKICRWYDIRCVNRALVKIRIRENSQSSDGEKNLRNELKYLNKVFADSAFKRKWFIKNKAYGFRYYSAAIAYREIYRTREARRYLLKAILTFPLIFANKKRLIFLFCTLFGIYRGEHSREPMQLGNNR